MNLQLQIAFGAFTGGMVAIILWQAFGPFAGALASTAAFYLGAMLAVHHLTKQKQ